MYVCISLVLQSFNCPHKDLQTFKTVILSSEKRPLNYFVKLTILWSSDSSVITITSGHRDHHDCMLCPHEWACDHRAVELEHMLLLPVSSMQTLHQLWWDRGSIRPEEVKAAQRESTCSGVTNWQYKVLHWRL